MQGLMGETEKEYDSEGRRRNKYNNKRRKE
jgi:hypothetical protein